MKTRPGADCGSDYQLLIAKVQLRLKAKRANVPPTRYDVDNIPNHLIVEVKIRFLQLLQTDEEEQTPNELWKDMKDIVQTEDKKHISCKIREKQPWISQSTLDQAHDSETSLMPVFFSSTCFRPSGLHNSNWASGILHPGPSESDVYSDVIQEAQSNASAWKQRKRR